jgi:hypothetical protein
VTNQPHYPQKDPRAEVMAAWGLPIKPAPPSKHEQKEHINQMLFDALSRPYRGVWNHDTQQYEMDDPDFAGQTYGYVMQQKLVHKAAVEGDMKAIQEVLDRTLGKPKQAVESVNMSMSYTEFLEQSAQEQQPQSQHPAAPPTQAWHTESLSPTYAPAPKARNADEYAAYFEQQAREELLDGV